MTLREGFLLEEGFFLLVDEEGFLATFFLLVGLAMELLPTQSKRAKLEKAWERKFEG